MHLTENSICNYCKDIAQKDKGVEDPSAYL